MSDANAAFVKAVVANAAAKSANMENVACKTPATSRSVSPNRKRKLQVITNADTALHIESMSGLKTPRTPANTPVNGFDETGDNVASFSSMTPSARHFRNRAERGSLCEFEGACAKILDAWHENAARNRSASNSEEGIVSGNNLNSPAKKRARTESQERSEDADSTTSGCGSPEDSVEEESSSPKIDTSRISDHFLEHFATESILNGAVFVGHVNTDTDSVAGAISAAYLFNGTPAISEANLNGEIAFALGEAGIETPILFDNIEDIQSKNICLVDHSEK